MATAIKLRDPKSGIAAIGYRGFSWTTLCFGPFPALLRGDFPVFLTYIGVAIILTAFVGVPGLIALAGMQVAWAFAYNEQHLQRLIQKGYQLSGADARDPAAHNAIKMIPSATGYRPVEADLSQDAYRIYLVRKYNIERNAALDKVIVGDRLFSDIDDALAHAHSIDDASTTVQLPKNSMEVWRSSRQVDRSFMALGSRVYIFSNGEAAIEKSNEIYPDVRKAIWALKLRNE